MLYIPPVNGDTGNPNRSYVNANPATGIEGSIPDATAFEYFQRELIAVIVAGGLTPSNVTLTQLRDAISNLIAANTSPDATETVKGKIELATAAEALGGTDALRAVTSAGLASSKSLSSSGYYKLPGGLIIQWTRGTSVGSSITVAWPVTFPNAVLCAFTTELRNAASSTTGNISIDPSTTQVVIYSGDTGRTHNVISIGY